MNARDSVRSTGGIVSSVLLAFFLVLAVSPGEGRGEPPRDRSARKVRKAALDVEKGSIVSMKLRGQPLSRIFSHLEKQTGNRIRCIANVYNPREDRNLPRKRVSLQFKRGTFWDLVQELEKVGGFAVLKNRSHRLEIIDLVGDEDRFKPSRIGQSVVKGAFWIIPEAHVGGHYLRVRPEPWIGLPTVRRYEVELHLKGNVVLKHEVNEVGLDVVAADADELLVNLHLVPGIEKAFGGKAGRIERLELKMELSVPISWKEVELPSFKDLGSEDHAIGDFLVGVSRVEEEILKLSNEVILYVQLEIEGFFPSTEGISLLDPRGREIKASGVYPRRGSFLVAFREFEKTRTVKDPLVYRLKLKVPETTVDHKLEVTFENLEWKVDDPTKPTKAK